MSLIAATGMRQRRWKRIAVRLRDSQCFLTVLGATLNPSGFLDGQKLANFQISHFVM
jgi:hypothetical protein